MAYFAIFGFLEIIIGYFVAVPLLLELVSYVTIDLIQFCSSTECSRFLVVSFTLYFLFTTVLVALAQVRV